MPDPSAFDARRRQPLLEERTYLDALPVAQGIAEHFATHPHRTGEDRRDRDALARLTVANTLWDLLLLRYTAGDPIGDMPALLETVVEAFESYARLRRAGPADHRATAFSFDDPEEYGRLLQVAGACELLRRGDLAPRIEALQSLHDPYGADSLVELLTHHITSRTVHPFALLAKALSERDTAVALADLDRYLDRWYPEQRSCSWHDTHLPDPDGNQWGHVGYWSFEAGAAVLALGIVDDTRLHRHMHYPKDLVAWARSPGTHGT